MIFPPVDVPFISREAIKYLLAPVHVYCVVSCVELRTYPISDLIGIVPSDTVTILVCPLAVGLAVSPAREIKLNTHESDLVLTVVIVPVVSTAVPVVSS